MRESIDSEKSVSGWTLAGLTDAERALLTAIRRWGRSGSARGMVAVRQSLMQAGVPVDALLPLFTLLGVLAADHSRAVEIRAPGCAEVALDEARLLDALAAAQAGEDDAAMDVLERWLPLVALCIAAAAARDLGASLGRAGQWLPGGRSGAGFGWPNLMAAE